MTFKYKEAAPEIIKPVFTTKGGMTAALNLENIVSININFELEDMANVDPTMFDEANFGILVWNASGLTLEEATHESETIAYEVLGAKFNKSLNSYGRWELDTQGIPAKKLGDALSFRTFYKNADGTYTYGRLISYNPTTYCYNKINAADSSEKLKNLCIALLNYGAAAQVEFKWNTDKLMNADLTAEQKVVAWDASLVDLDYSVSAAKEGALARDTSKVIKRQGSVTLEGALDFNFSAGVNFTPASVKAYYWTAEDYAKYDVLTTENASSTGEAVKNNDPKNGEHFYDGIYSNVPAKKMFENVYGCLEFTDADGNVYYSGVVCYTPARYAYINCDKTANGELTSNALLSRAVVVYGDAARTYFAK